MTLTVTSPPSEATRAWRWLNEAADAAGLYVGCRRAWEPGTWSIRLDGAVIWAGDVPAPNAWVDAMLEAWWGDGGGCC